MDKEDVETLKWELAILDNHDIRINEIMDRLNQLGHTKSSPTVTAPPMSLETAAEPSQLLHRRLNHVESILRSINSTFESLTLGPNLATCLVRHLQKQVGRISVEQFDHTRDILSFVDLSSALAKTLLTSVYKLNDCSVIRLLLHQSKKLKVASNCLRLMSPTSMTTY